MLKKTLSLLLALTLLAPCLVTVKAQEADGAENTIEQVYEQADAASFSVMAGTVTKGGLANLAYNDKQALEVAAAQNEGRSFTAEVELSCQPGAAPQAWNEAFLRVCATASAQAALQGVWVYDQADGQYEALPLEEGAGGFAEAALPAPFDEYVSPAGQVQFRLCFAGTQAFTLALDQAQLVYAYRAPAGAMQLREYKVASGILEQGTLGDGTGFPDLADRDGKPLSVRSAGNKVSWYATVPLHQNTQAVRTVRIDYAGSVSAETNELWLSLYRFDTENWETVGVLPGQVDTVHRSLFVSGAKLQSYLSPDGDLRVRLYNSAGKEFVRSTDYLCVTAYSDLAYRQESCAPTGVFTEYGSSTGGAAELARVDGSCLVTQSSPDKKAAVQLTFQAAAPRNSIREMSFSFRIQSGSGVNPQYISLLNRETGKFSVIKTLTGRQEAETVHVTLDSLHEIRKYLGADGQVVLRIYNSAREPFARTLDYAQMTVTYGGFESFTVAQISDVHELIGTENFKSIIREINDGVDEAFTVVTGDISDHGTPEQYALYLKDRELFQNPVYTTPGNHDVRWWNANGKRTFTDSVGPLYQSFDYGGVHFVLLDSTVNFELDGKINKAQLEWLRRDMAAVGPDTPVIWFAHHPFKINNNVTARHELLQAAQGHNVIAYMSGHVHYYGNVKEDGVPVNYITYVKDNAAQEFVTIEFTPNYYYVYKHKASDHSKELWLAGRMDNTRQMELAVTQAEPASDGSVQVSVSIPRAPDGVLSVQARVDNYGPYTQLSKGSDGIWSGRIDTSKYTPALVNGAHFVGVEAFDGNGEKWTSYADYYAPDPKVGVKWVFETGDMLQASATVDGGRVYVGSNDGSLYCIDRASGAELWRYATGGPVISKPAVSGGRLVFGSGDGQVYCLNAENGEEYWRYAAGGSVLSDPLVEQDKVYIGCGDGKIYCLDLQTGESVWQYQTEGLMRQRPVIEGGVLYAFVRDTHIWYALQAQTGELYWRGEAGTDESLFVCGDVRPVVAGGKLWCIDAQNTRPGYIDLHTGELAWTGALEKVSSRGMATDGKLVFYTSNNGRQITAYDAGTAQIAWQKDLRYNGRDGDLQQFQIDSGLVCKDGVLFHLAERGRVSAFDAATGTLLWRIDAAAFPERVFWATPEVADGLLLGSGIDGKLYAVEFPSPNN